MTREERLRLLLVAIKLSVPGDQYPGRSSTIKAHHLINDEEKVRRQLAAPHWSNDTLTSWEEQYGLK